MATRVDPNWTTMIATETAWMVTMIEILGGLALLAGVFVVIASILLIVSIAALVALCLFGPNAASADDWLARRRLRAR